MASTIGNFVDVSVLVPAYRAEATLDRCLASLLAQDYPGSYEVVLCASADSEESLPRPAPDDRLRILTSVPRLGAAAARNRAAAAAGGQLLAFTDADVDAPADWLARLAAAAEASPCVAGSVRNGTPGSVVGTAEYLLEFADLHPNRRPAAVHFGATCNLALRRETWEQFGPFPEDLEGGEDTLLTIALRRQGLFSFAPDAAVLHLNRTKWQPFLRHQYGFGRFSARLAQMEGLHAGGRGRAVLTRYAVLAPLASVLRVGWVYLRVATLDRAMLRQAIRCFPALFAGSLAWAAGLVAERVAERREGSRG